MMDEKKMDERFMREAIRQARKAGALMEVPIGCVIVYEGKIIARCIIFNEVKDQDGKIWRLAERQIKIRSPMRN